MDRCAMTDYDESTFGKDENGQNHPNIPPDSNNQKDRLQKGEF